MMMKTSDSTPADHQVYCNTSVGFHACPDCRTGKGPRPHVHAHASIQPQLHSPLHQTTGWLIDTRVSHHGPRQCRHRAAAEVYAHLLVVLIRRPCIDDLSGPHAGVQCRQAGAFAEQALHLCMGSIGTFRARFMAIGSSSLSEGRSSQSSSWMVL